MKQILTASSLILVLFFTGCSLKYETEVNAEDLNPEFSFTNATVSRYEDAVKTAEITAGSVEQYKGSDKTYAKKVNFNVYNKKGEIETQGECGLLFFDSGSDLYELYEKIWLYNKANNANFYANGLRWNGKTEQLTSSRSDTVKIEKDDMVIYGSGFSASGISRTYKFTGTVSGDITTKEGAQENTPEVQDTTDGGAAE